MIPSNTKIDFVIPLRGLAALSVVISHYLSTFWYKRDSVAHLINAPILSSENYLTPDYVTWINQFPLFDLGSFGVGLFFIISGFLIPFSLQNYNGLGFFVNRILRIVPTYIIGFSITLFALYLSTKYFKTDWPYRLKEIIIHYLPGLRDLYDSKIIDVVIWTLEIEMKFYLIAALSILWFRRYSYKVFLIPVLFFLLTSYFSYMLPQWAANNFAAFIWARIYMMASQFVIFMYIGVIFHYMYCHKIDIDKGYLGIGGLFALFCIAWWVGPYADKFILVWSYAFALLAFMSAYTYPLYFKSNSLFNFLTEISYPLYIIHSISGYIILRIMLDKGFKIWISLLAVFFISFLFSWIVHLVIEKPSHSIGKKWGNRIGAISFKSFLQSHHAKEVSH